MANEEQSGSVVECLTHDRGAERLTGGTAFCLEQDTLSAYYWFNLADKNFNVCIFAVIMHQVRKEACCFWFVSNYVTLLLAITFELLDLEV